MSRRLLGAAGMLLMVGCGGPFYVRVPYLLTNDPTVFERSAAAQNIYLLIHRSSGGSVALDLNSSPSTSRSRSMHPALLASELHRQLRPFFGSLAAYRVSPQPLNEDPFVAKLSPSSVLEVWLDEAQITVGQVAVATKTSTGTVTYAPSKWAQKSQSALRFRFSSYPSLKTWADGRLASENADELYSEPGDSEYEKGIATLTQQLAAQLAQRIPPALTVRAREIWKSKDNEASKKAFAFAERGAWSKAQEIWTTRLSSGTGTWHDWMNLAALAESQRRYSLASDRYDQAEKLSAGDSEAQKINWREIHNDLQAGASMKMASLPSVENWFRKTVAIVPFSDESVSIDGPQSIRILIAANLVAGGYRVIPVTDGDKIFQSHGLSDGGQLAAFKTPDLAKWAKADWLIFGDIDQFNEINVGIYVKRAIRGTITVSDGTRTVYSSAIPIENSSIPTKSKDLLSHFLSALGKTWAEHAAHHPLEEEVARFVEANIEGIPQKPR